MAKSAAIREPNMPWLDDREDRFFRILTIIMLILFLGVGITMSLQNLPELVQKNLVDVSPRLAQLILEKQKVEPPPKPEAPPPEKEKQPEKKKEEPKKEEPKKEKKKEVKKESAREVAEKSGLIALSDELEDLRESFDLDDVALPQQTTGDQAADLTAVASTSALLSAGAGQSSGGIQTDTLNRNLKTSELAQRKTTSVESKIDTGNTTLAKVETTQKQKSSGQGQTAGKRTADEIERVFQKNKGAIFNIYNRALRKNPSLQGQVVVELTIAPNGAVTNVDIVSSELDDAALERKLALRIKRFKFRQANVAEIVVTYPIDFLPS